MFRYKIYLIFLLLKGSLISHLPLCLNSCKKGYIYIPLNWFLTLFVWGITWWDCYLVVFYWNSLWRKWIRLKRHWKTAVSWIMKCVFQGLRFLTWTSSVNFWSIFNIQSGTKSQHKKCHNSVSFLSIFNFKKRYKVMDMASIMTTKMQL